MQKRRLTEEKEEDKNGNTRGLESLKREEGRGTTREERKRKRSLAVSRHVSGMPLVCVYVTYTVGDVHAPENEV